LPYRNYFILFYLANQENIFTINNSLLKSFAVDSEIKVMNKYLTDESLRKYFLKEKNLIKNSNGRGNNWALGYDINFKEFKQEKSLVQDSFEKINSFIEKCDFLRGFMFIHSLFGGTGSGISTRLIEMLREEYPKFDIIDVAIKGLDGKKILKIFSKYY